MEKLKNDFRKKANELDDFLKNNNIDFCTFISAITNDLNDKQANKIISNIYNLYINTYINNK